MGCTSSNFSFNSSESSYGWNMQRRSKPRKRNFSYRVDATASSGLATDESSVAPKRCSSSTSTWSDSSTPPPKTQIKRPAFPKISRKDMPKALAKLTLSNKTTDKQQAPLQQQHRVLERSCGYFSGSTRSTDNLDSSWGSVSQNSKLLNTQDMNQSSNSSSDESQHEPDQPVSNLKMEILMMRENFQIMPKTSSPFCARRDPTTSSVNVSYINLTPPSATYCRWRQYLHDSPAYSLKNVTALPEAIAGQFSPANHPAYTQLQNFECVSAPKRYRLQPRKNMNSPPSVPLAAVVPGYGITHTIESTEL